MCEGIRNVLLALIENEESISIRYLGGSQPGGQRKISPISLSGDKLRAKCHSIDKIKTFDIRKIQITDEKLSDNPRYGEVNMQVFETMEDVKNEFCTLYLKEKWGVEYSDLRFEVFDFYKNGKRKKTAFIAILFQVRSEEAVNSDVTLEITPPGITQIDATKKSGTRPWVVGDPRKGGFRSFSTLHKAATAFFERFSLIACQADTK